MCGLVGAVGTLEWKHRKVLKDLFFLNSLRGKDSTGLAVVDRKRGVFTRKFTVPGYEFIDLPIFDKITSHNDQLWLGHGRFKTTGDINKNNAHPFEVMDEDGDVCLIGAHNGTLNNKYEVERLVGDKFDTDSEGLFNLLAQNDPKDAINSLRGAWSLVWWEPAKDQLNFCRNKERPLIFARTKDNKVLFWASEAWMLLAAARRNDVELLCNDKGLSCWSTLVDTRYILDIPQQVGADLPEFKKEGGYTGDTVIGFRQERDWKNWYDLADDELDLDNERFTVGKNVKEKKEERKKEAAKAGSAGTNVITIGTPEGMARGFEGKLIDKQVLAEVKKAGCQWCGNPIDKVFAFLDETSLVCGHCLHDTHPKTDGDRVHPDSSCNPSSEASPEYDKLLADAAVAASKKAVG